MIDVCLLALVILTYFVLWRVAVLFRRGDLSPSPLSAITSPIPVNTASHLN